MIWVDGVGTGFSEIDADETSALQGARALLGRETDEILSMPFPSGSHAPFRGEKGCQAPPLSALIPRPVDVSRFS